MDVDTSESTFWLNGFEQLLTGSLERSVYSFEEADVLLGMVMDGIGRQRGRELTSFVPGNQLNTARNIQQLRVRVLEAMADKLWPYAAIQIPQAAAEFLDKPPGEA